MKKLLLILLLGCFSVIAISQTNCPRNKTTVIAKNINLAAIAGTDSLFYFTIPQMNNGSGSYVVQIIPKDTIEGANLGVNLLGSIDSRSPYNAAKYGTLCDSLSISSGDINIGKAFVGSSWPFIYGAVELHPNGVTDGDVDILICPN
jgi:hypothetical protein